MSDSIIWGARLVLLAAWAWPWIHSYISKQSGTGPLASELFDLD